MATIPDISAIGGSAVPRPTLDVAVARPQQSDAGRIMSGIGRDIEDASSTIAETNARQDAIMAQAKSNQLASAVTDLRLGQDGFAGVRGAGAVGSQFLDQYQKRYDDRVASVRSTITAPAQLRLFDQHASVQNLQFRGQLLAHQAEETDKFNDATEVATIERARKQVFDSSGEPTGTAAGIAQMEWAIRQRGARLGWSPEVVDQTTQAYLGKVYDDAAALMTARDPNGMLGMIGARLGAQQAAPAAVATDPNLPRGIRNNNPGNLEQPTSGPWAGQTGTDGRFAIFATPQDGIRAATRNLLAYQDTHGLNTIEGLVSRWAPAADGNDVGSYVASIAKETGLPADKPIDLHDSGVMMKLVTAMVRHENGQQPYGADVIRQGVALGLGLAPLNPVTTPAALAGPSAPGATPLDLESLKLTRTGNTVIDGASVPQLLEWRRAAHVQAEQQLGGLRTGLEQKTKDYQAMVLAGVAPPPGSSPTIAEYTTAFGPNAASRYQSEVANYQQVGTALGLMKDASFTERRNLIAGLAPQAGPGFEAQQRMQATLAKANDLFEQKLAEDPAIIARRAAPVQAAGSAMQSVLSDQKATPAARAAAVDAYVSATTAEQQRLGVQNLRSDVLGEAGKARQPGVQLLTNGEANSITDQFRANPANGAQIMDGLAAQWGKYFPQVFAQLARDDKLPPAALVIPNMATPFGKETLARLSDPKAAKAVMDSLAPTDKKDIETKLAASNEPFFNSLSYQQGGQATFAIVRQQQMLLAANSVLQGHSASDAAKMAFEETVGHQYQFTDTLRIPKAQQPDQVLRGATAVAANPALLATQAPQSFRPNLAPADRDALWHDAMRTGATWVANGDETGATLYVRARNETGAAALFAVRGPDGKAMTWDWNQLRTIAASLPPPKNEAPLGGAVPRYGIDVGGAVGRARERAAEIKAGG